MVESIIKKESWENKTRALYRIVYDSGEQQ